MKRRNFFFIMLGNAAAWLVSGCGKVADSASSPAASPTPNKVDKSAVLAYQKENQAQLEASVQRASQQQDLADAVGRTEDFRRQLQLGAQDQWSTLIHRYLQTFDNLRKQAAESATKAVKCTVCGGRGTFNSCLICDDLGKCPTCSGRRTTSYGGICPTCQGTGKCFFCHGSGRMACPFCDDGSVYANQPMPPYEIPIS
jgi:hypothetical protein